MMYPFMTLDDNTEIVHSEMQPDGTVKVYMEQPDAQTGFRHATCYLPSYRWEDISGFSDQEIARYQEVIESTAHLILQFSQEGGFEHAASL
jgi:hypothetical protein